MNEATKDIQFDFKNLSKDEMKAMVSEKKRILMSLDSEKKDLQAERKEQVQIVKALRSAVFGIERSGTGRKKLLGEFHSLRKQAKIHREKGMKSTKEYLLLLKFWGSGLVRPTSH